MSTEKPAQETRSCHGPAKAKIPDHEKQSAPRQCGHCTGVVSADASIAKTIAPPMTVLDSMFVIDASPAMHAGAMSPPFATLRHSGLSPPAPPRTLLDLACLLTT
jgi:hypothetical protein